MKHIAIAFILTLLLLMGCGPQMNEKYKDIQSVLNEMITVTEAFGNDFEKADGASDKQAVLKAFYTYIDTTKLLKKKLKAYQDLHEETRGGKYPEGLLTLKKKLDDKYLIVSKAFTRLGKYGEDSDIKKMISALQTMQIQ